MRAICLIAVLALVGCGADGAPEPPTKAQTPPPGISLSGTAKIGVIGSF